MHAPTRQLRIESYMAGVPEAIKPEYERAYVAFFLHYVLGETEMSKQTPKLHAEFYGPNRNPVVTQELWRNVGHQAHEDAQRLIEERTIARPRNLVNLMVATGENPLFLANFRRTRTVNVIA